MHVGVRLGSVHIDSEAAATTIKVEGTIARLAGSAKLLTQGHGWPCRCVQEFSSQARRLIDAAPGMGTDSIPNRARGAECARRLEPVVADKLAVRSTAATLGFALLH